MPRLVALLVVLLCAAAAPAKAPPGVRVDWRAGRLLADAGAAADPRAPDIEIARVRAEHAALGRAREKLVAAVPQLPWGEGGVLADRLTDKAVAARVDAVLARARIVDVSYASDGGVRLTAGVPLEALRLAVAPADPPLADGKAPTAIVVDATRLKPAPVLGVGVTAGGATFRAPTVWTREAGDPRAGPRVQKAVATAFRGGTLALDMDPGLLETAVKAGALIVVVTP